MGRRMKQSPAGTHTGGGVLHLGRVSSLLPNVSHTTPELPSQLKIHHLLEPLSDLYVVSLLPVSLFIENDTLTHC